MLLNLEAGWPARAVAAGRWALPRRTRPLRLARRVRLARLDHARADPARRRGRAALAAAEPELRRAAHQGRRVRHAARGLRASAQRRHALTRPAARAARRPDHATLYVDTSGEALFKRGWRDGSGGVKGEAPLKETLAAAMLAAAGWQGRAEDGPLLDPCCGAGTIAIEAAQMACGIAPACSALRLRAPAALQAAARAWQRLKRGAAAACMRPRCRCSPAT
jgi:23S rRNA G2445 N2-methylase RlmL